jgi:hypothetical protein
VCSLCSPNNRILRPGFTIRNFKKFPKTKKIPNFSKIDR